MQVHGKGRRTVPVLVTKEMVAILMTSTGSVRLPPDYLFVVFDRIYDGSIQNIRGSDCIRSVTEQAGSLKAIKYEVAKVCGHSFTSFKFKRTRNQLSS